MNKITKELHETHAKRLQAIINPQSQFIKFFKRPELNTILKLELNTLKAIEKLLPESKLEEKLTSDALVKEFNTLAQETFAIDENYKYGDEADLIDNVNYLITYCKNIYKVDLDEMVKGKAVNVETPNINFNQTRGQFDDPGMDAANAFNMGAMGFGGSIYENPLLNGKAFARLRDDISKGKVYQYTTKPKIIPVMKWILFVLTCLTTIAALITSIFVFMVNGSKVMVSGNEVTWTTVSRGIFYIILAIFSGYTCTITTMSLIKGLKSKNENDYYSFNIVFYVSTAVLGIMFYLLDLSNTWVSIPAFSSRTAMQVFGFQAWRIMVLVGASLNAVIIIPMIIGGLKAPKVDAEKMETILHKYIDEMTGTTPAQPTGGVDIQKPVEVKKPEEPEKSQEQAN